MNLSYKNIYFILAVTALLTLFCPAVYPSARLMFFVPFLIIFYYQNSFVACLWASLLCGLTVDLLSSKSRLGLHALVYILTTAFLYKKRLNFFRDNQSTLPVMTFFFAVIATAIQWSLLYIFEHDFRLSVRWAMTDLLVMPLLDAVYAYTVFILPWALFSKPQRKGSDYFS